MQVKTRLAAALSMALVAGAASWAAIGQAGAATATSGGIWGISQSLPGFAGPGSTPVNGSGSTRDVACTAPGDCVAVGIQQSGSGSAATLMPVVVTETAGTWGSPQPISGTASLGRGSSSDLTKVSCSDAGDCTAIGAYSGTDGRGHAFYATETAGVWSAATAVSEAGQPAGTYSVVTGVSCPPSAAGYCAIVGNYDTPFTTTVNGTTTSGTTIVPFILDQAEGTWTAPQPVPGLASLPAAGNAGLSSVSCAAAEQCTAGGGIAGLPFVASETPGTSGAPGTWGNAQPVTGVPYGSITAISCPDASDCTAAGSYDDSANRPQAFTADETKQGSWGPATLLANSALLEIIDNSLELSCSSAGNCVLAGTAEIRLDNSAYPGAVADTETSSGQWGSLTPVSGFPVVSAGPGIDIAQSNVTGLSCAPGGECVIVGEYYTDSGPDTTVGFAVTVAGGGVGTEQLILPAAATDQQAPALSCPQSGFCTLTFGQDGAPEVVTEATGAAVTLATSAPQVMYGSEQAETLTASVTSPGGMPAGTVTVTSGTTPVCTVTLVSSEGTCSLSATMLPVGTDTLTATYSGDATHAANSSTATVTVSPQSGLYTPVTPVRLLDTRNGTGAVKAPVGPGKAIALQVTGRGGVPVTGVTAVVLNVTATGPAAGGFVTVYPDGQPRPAEGSNLNFTKGETIANLVTVAVGSDGEADLYNGSGGTVSLVADLQGFYTTSTGSGLVTAGPARILDTRNGTGDFRSPVGAGKVIALQVTDDNGVPASGVTAVVLNVTATGPAAGGFVTAYPDGQPRPAQGSNLNFTKGETIANLVIVGVGSDGQADLYNGSGGTVNLVADLQGYFTAGGGSRLVTAGPVRVLDTRNGTGGFSRPVGPGQAIALPVTGQDGVPASGVAAIVLNVTATGPAKGGFVTAYPDGQPRPAQGSNLNFTKGETIPNLVIVTVGRDGKVDLYNGSGGTVNVVADLFGYYAN